MFGSSPYTYNYYKTKQTKTNNKQKHTQNKQLKPGRCEGNPESKKIQKANK